MEQGKNYRHELKYMISYPEYEAMRSLLRIIMKSDPHASSDGTYHIRSIYFDNYDDKALREKIDGSGKREKFRIRYYNDDFSLYNYAKISVNDEYWGVYLALEAVEESFMLRNYGTQDGELYKPDSMEMGGENAGISNPSMPDRDSSDFDFQNIDISKFEDKTPPNSTGMSASQDSGPRTVLLQTTPQIPAITSLASSCASCWSLL